MGLYTWPCPGCYQKQQTYTATSSEGQAPHHALCALCTEKANAAGQTEADYIAAVRKAEAAAAAAAQA